MVEHPSYINKGSIIWKCIKGNCVNGIGSKVKADLTTYGDITQLVSGHFKEGKLNNYISDEFKKFLKNDKTYFGMDDFYSVKFPYIDISDEYN